MEDSEVGVSEAKLGQRMRLDWEVLFRLRSLSFLWVGGEVIASRKKQKDNSLVSLGDLGILYLEVLLFLPPSYLHRFCTWAQ